MSKEITPKMFKLEEDGKLTVLDSDVADLVSGGQTATDSTNANRNWFWCDGDTNAGDCRNMRDCSGGTNTGSCTNDQLCSTQQN